MHLRSAHNARQGLLRLPTEVLTSILEAVPDLASGRWHEFQPSWRSIATDGSMLIPMTHTCHRLREIALAHHSLWATLTTKKSQLVPNFVERSRPAPLTVAAWSLHNIPAIFDVFFTGAANRIQELHLFSIEIEHMSYLFKLLKCPLPALKSLTLTCYLVASRWGDKPFELPLSRERNPSLQYLALKDVPFLPETGFSTLTHLSLTYVTVPSLYSRVIDFVSDCPRLESVALSGLWSEADTLDVGAYKTPLPLSHLRRVTLHELYNQSLQLFSFLLHPTKSDSAYHILNYDPRDQASLMDFLLEPVRMHKHLAGLPAEDPQLCISLHPDRNGDFSTWECAPAITVTTREQTRRLGACSGQRRVTGSSLTWISSLLSANAAALTSIPEVWLVNATPSTFLPRPPSPAPCNAIDSPLIHLPALETLVLVIDHTFLCATAWSGLYLLPSSQDPTFVVPNLTTLRLIHGYSNYALAQQRAAANCMELPDTLDFTATLQELSTGAYGYLRNTHLVVQTVGCMRLDTRDLESLREYFKTVQRQRLEALPAMPVRGEDPASRGCERWPGALW